MLAPRRHCFDYSYLYNDVAKRWLLAWNQTNKLHSVLHILYTNSKFSIVLPYNSTDLLPTSKHN